MKVRFIAPCTGQILNDKQVRYIRLEILEDETHEITFECPICEKLHTVERI